MRVLISAYACEPGRGSEPGVGWTVVREMARYHDIWVLTRPHTRPKIETELARYPQLSMRVVYWDIPGWAGERGKRGAHIHYYLWQLCILRIARRLHTEVGFDLIHHVTFVRYWAPSFLCFLGVPFIWGPVGGGESAPRSFWRGGGWWSLLYESLRGTARWFGEKGPFVRATARRSAVALGTTPESAARLRALGCKYVDIFSQVGLPDDEFKQLDWAGIRPRSAMRFVSVGVLLHLKGFDISLRAFAQANIAGAEYWLIGDGRERQRLEKLSSNLGIADRVTFLGVMPRRDVLSRLQDCDVMLHPALHDSGGWAPLEAMAAGLPVICLDLGGSATVVAADSGFKIHARDPTQAGHDMAAAMIKLAQDRELRSRLSRGARERVRHEFLWSSKAIRFNEFYQLALSDDDEQSAISSLGTSMLSTTRATPAAPHHNKQDARF
jgi:glycosyltransferase involved in cell wall biosynthesis